MSATPDSTLTNPEQRIADLERQLAARDVELAEAGAQQAAIAEVLQVINSSPRDLAPVFDVILQKAHALCGSSHGALFLRDGDRFLPAAMSAPELLAAPLRQGEMGFDAPLVRPLLAGEAFAHIKDLTLIDHPLARAAVAVGVRTLLSVPLRKDGTLIGMINAARFEVHPFSDKQIALLQNFAAQAVIAMENARLITETREALDQQTATAEVLGVINSSPGDLAPVFDAILEKAHTLCDAATGTLRVIDGEMIRAVAFRGQSGEFADQVKQGYPLASAPLLASLRDGALFVHISDVAERDDSISRLSTASGNRTILAVPLRKDDALLGMIVAGRKEVRPFTHKEIALLQNFAAQAVIAMENARLITETREALEQQTATAQVLGVINSSPGDLKPVFGAILEKAHSLCGVWSRTLLLRDGEGFQVVAAHGASDYYNDRILNGSFHPPEGTPCVLRGAPLIHLADATADDSYRKAPAYAQRIDSGGIRTLLQVPLRKDGELLGVITAFRREVRPFTDKQIALLQNFAAQAVIAIDNARLITETREALEQQTATAEVLGVINSSPGDLAPVFDAILEKAHSLCGAAFGGLLIYDGDRFKAVALHNVPAAFAEIARQGFSATPPNPIARLLEGEPLVHIADLKEIAEVAPTGSLPRASVDLAGIRTLLLVPLRKGDALLGVITAYRQEVCPFSDKQIALLQNFAAQAVIAIENARLITETQEALEQQTATAEVLQVINSSPGDLAPVFDAILEKAHSLCGVAFGFLQLYDSGKLRAVALRGVPDSVAAVLRQPIEPTPGLPPARLLDGERIVQEADMAALVADGRGCPRAQSITENGVRTALFVPLRKDANFLGCIAAFRKEVQPFSNNEIALLENFASQAVIAMENARLLGELRQRTEEVGELNSELEARVAAQVDELSRVGRLKRFLAPQLAELIVSHGDEKILESHRREIVVVFCDLRGYTAFTETAEPEEVLDFLRQYHGALGPLVSQFEGTLDQFSGDGIMVFFNDPVPCPDPAERAVKMAMAMREAASKLITGWRRHGSELGFGAGIAQGYATLGQIGFSDRSGYTAIGTVSNLAARLCAEAKDGQILVSSRIAEAVGAIARLEDLGTLELRGLRRPVAAFNVAQRTSAADARPNLTVVANEPRA